MEDYRAPTAGQPDAVRPELPTLEQVVRLIQEWRAETSAVVARVASLERELRGLDLRHQVLNRILSGLLADRGEEEAGVDGPATAPALPAATSAPSGQGPASPSAFSQAPHRHSSVGEVTPVRNWRRSSSDATEEDSESSHVAHVVSSFQAQHTVGVHTDTGPDDQSPFVCPFSATK